MSTARPTVPFLDLKAQHRALRDELLASLGEVLDGAAFALGPKVAEFEESFARFCGVRHSIGVNSGTSALHLALRALGVGPFDEVVTVSHTFVSTAWAISYCGARPVFVDVEPRTMTLDPDLLEAALTPRTRAIVPVHLYGHPVDMDPILEIADRHGVPVLEDAAQAHGALYHGHRVGSLGKAACFSFYPGKNLGACGEGGAVVTDDRSLAERVRALRDHAQSVRHRHEEIGFNARMDGFQGAVLAIKLRHLELWNERRRQAARLYTESLHGIPDLELPTVAGWATPVFHLYVVRHPQRDRLRELLADRGVQAALHYPTPVHLQPAYAELGHGPGSFPVAEQIASTCLSLPISEQIRDEQVLTVCRDLAAAVQELQLAPTH